MRAHPQNQRQDGVQYRLTLFQPCKAQNCILQINVSHAAETIGKKQPRLGAYTTMPADMPQKFTLESAQLQVLNLPHHDTVGSPNASGNRRAFGPRLQPYYSSRAHDREPASSTPYLQVRPWHHRLVACLHRIYVDSNIVYQPPALTTPWVGDDSVTPVKNAAYHWLECRYRCSIRWISRDQLMDVRTHSLVAGKVINMPLREAKYG